MINKNSKIFVAGHNGLVGSAIVRKLKEKGFKKIITIAKSKLNFHPSNWVNTFNNWIENIEPWCISRQIWWGHRIPAWYSKCGKIFVAENEKKAFVLAKKNIKIKLLI